MRALAEFTMRGRWQAAVVAVFGSLVPFLSPAVVNLVTLRKGVVEGVLILLWALLPTLLLVNGSYASLMIAITLTILLLGLLAAEILKLTAAWSSTLLVIVVSCGLSVLTINQLYPEHMLALDEHVAKMFQELAATAELSADEVFIPEREFILGISSYILAVNVFLSLLLARWWQSMLYNPGGLRAEFHQLRLPVLPAAVLLGAVIVCYLGETNYSGWAGLLGMPLLLVAISLVHYSVATLGLGSHWLVLFYIGLILIGPLSVVLVGLGFVDSIMNIRSRLVPKSDEQE